MSPKPRKKGRRKAPARRAARKPRFPRAWLWRAALLLAVLGVGYLLYLDHVVRTEFAGKRWELPARVYARPLELFPGERLTPAALNTELKALGYQPVGWPSRPGSYSSNGERIVMMTREFTFWDGREPPRTLRVEFAGGRVASLSDAKGAEVTLARLEPILIGSIYPEKREDRVLVKLSQVPHLLTQALIATEDRNFYHHHGIDPRAIARAVWADLRAGALVQGGSTLTQQLVKNFFLSSRRTLWRKLNEAAMAVLLELHFSKDEILEAYLNEVYLGQDGRRAIHGFGLASRFYFGRPLDELKLQEMATLVALVRGPSYYDPRLHPKRTLHRRNLILDLMAKQGMITDAQALAAKVKPLGVLADAPSGVTRYPAFMDLVRRQLRRDYRDQDLTTEGLRIFTTLDPQVQNAAEQAVERVVPQLSQEHRIPAGKLQGAMIVTEPQNGEVQAVVGGADVRYAGFDRALDAARPVGSLLKPGIYLTALEQPKQYTLATLLEDEPIHIKGPEGEIWSPNNYEREAHGQVTLYTALAHSYNLATVHLGMALGLNHVIDTLHRLGLQGGLRAYPAVLLGAVDLTPLDVTEMYQTLASGGFRMPLRAIRAVTTASGAPLQRYDVAVNQVVRPGPMFLLTRLMQAVPQEGTAHNMDRQLVETLMPAGKTGTTDDQRDSWFAGFTGDHLAVVWLGRDDNGPTGLTGAAGAMRVWQRLMERIAHEPLDLPTPDSVEFAQVDTTDGRVFEKGCSSGTKLPFLRGSIPAERSPCDGGLFGSGSWAEKLWR